MTDLMERDARVVWHPYTQHGVENTPLPVRGAKGAWLELEDGRKVLDGISSWWATLHGHGHPALVRAMKEQAERLDHVLFAGATHEPAVRLAEELLQIVPRGLSRVFFSDDGSTAVEAGIKMVLQSWVQRDQPQRRVLIALEGAYHGDTFGAMAASDPDPFFLAFAPLLFEVRRVPPDDTEALTTTLDELGNRAAGFILEPLIQGAAGMRVMSETFVRHARALCDQHGIPMIADEVMTGFGRTGSMFACERAAISPDVLCLSKGITGGTLPLAVTLATDEIFASFLHNQRTRFFPHGHTYTANPITCAVALASLDICQRENTPQKLDAIGRAVHDRIADLGELDHVRDLRSLGGMVALDLHTVDEGYTSDIVPLLRRTAVDHGVLLRPLGNVLYALPPSCLDEREVEILADAMRAVAVAAAP